MKKETKLDFVIKEKLLYLTDLERLIIESKYGLFTSEQLTYSEISSLVGHSIASVYKIEARALKKMKSNLYIVQKTFIKEEKEDPHK